MTQPQVVVGYFETMAEAQQAVQCLLADQFTHDQISLSSNNLATMPGNGPIIDDDQADGSSGRFLSSLFNTCDEVPCRRNMVVTVQINSTADSARAVSLLGAAGAEDITTHDQPDVGPVPCPDKGSPHLNG